MPASSGAPDPRAIIRLRIDLALRALGVLLVAMTIAPFADELVRGLQLINWHAVWSYPIGTTGRVGSVLGGLGSQFSLSGVAAWLLYAAPWIAGVAAGGVLVHRPPQPVRRFLLARFG